MALAALFLWHIGAAFGQTVIRVPQDRPTIQAGIDSASNGDTVMVAPGTYAESIDFRGKGITVTSGATDAGGAGLTTIFAPGSGPVVVMHSGEPLNATINGFTLTHTQGSKLTAGDGVAIYNASGTISNNIITGVPLCAIDAAKAPALTIQGNRVIGNILNSTPGHCVAQEVFTSTNFALMPIAIDYCGDVRMTGNTISNNTDTLVQGGATSFDEEIDVKSTNSLFFENNTFSNNTPDGFIFISAVPQVTFVQNQVFSNFNQANGPAVDIQAYNTQGNTPLPVIVTIVNNTVYGNSGKYAGSLTYQPALGLSQGSDPATVVISNNLFEAPTYLAATCGLFSPSKLTFSHNDLFVPAVSQTFDCPTSSVRSSGNLSVDPQFTAPASGDLHVVPASPVVAAGDINAPQLPAADFAGKNRIVCGTIDMGIYENHPHPPITLSSSPNPSVGGSAVTFTAKVQGNCNIPTGVLMLLDGQTQIAAITLDPNGNAVFTTAALFVGTHQITATYPGDFNFESSTSNTVQQTVTGYPSATTLQVTPNPASAFQSVAFTAGVTSQFGTPTGSVSFYAGSNLLATAPINTAGLASTSLNTLGVGVYNITAVYNASVNFAGSTSPVVIETVVGATTSTALASTPNPSGFGQGVTFTATVKAPQSSVMPAGMVNFREGSSILGSAALNANGVASFTTSLLTAGNHTIFADYTGSSSDNASTSSALVQVVQPISAMISLTGTPNPAALSQTVTLMATASPVGNVAVPAGSITFKDQFGTLGTVPLTGGTAIFTTSSLATGVHNIVATFNATGNFAGAVSPVLAELIQSYDFSVTLNPVALSLAAGKQGQITVQLAGVGNLPGNITLQANQIPMYATFGFNPQTVTFSPGGSGSSILSIDTTQAPRHAFLETPVHHNQRLIFAFTGLFAAPLLFLRRRHLIQGVCSLLLFAGLVALSGCTNIYYSLNRVAPGTYSIPITATDTTTNITHTATLTLTVTP